MLSTHFRNAQDQSRCEVPTTPCRAQGWCGGLQGVEHFKSAAETEGPPKEVSGPMRVALFVIVGALSAAISARPVSAGTVFLQQSTLSNAVVAGDTAPVLAIDKWPDTDLLWRASAVARQGSLQPGEVLLLSMVAAADADGQAPWVTTVRPLPVIEVPIHNGIATRTTLRNTREWSGLDIADSGMHLMNGWSERLQSVNTSDDAVSSSRIAWSEVRTDSLTLGSLKPGSHSLDLTPVPLPSGFALGCASLALLLLRRRMT
jgi:hypothetical protein